MKSTVTALSLTATTAVSSAVANSTLADYGLSWIVIGAAGMGALTAIPGLWGRGRGIVVSGVVFGLSLGVLGGPVLASLAAAKWSISHALAPALLAFLMAHFAYDDLRRGAERTLGFLFNILAKMGGKGGA